MSHYTTEVRFICENYAGYDESQDYPIDTVISKALDKVFDFSFPIYDEAYRSVLETKILRHYYTREIGFETVALWKHFLNMKLNEIMPYYNQLYESETLKFNPYIDTDVTTTSDRDINHEGSTSDTGTSRTVRTDNLTETSNTSSDTTTEATRTDNLAHSDTTTTSNTQYDLYSDTPQGAVTGLDNNNYLTNARKVTNNGTENNNGTNTGTVKNEGTQNVTGAGTVTNTGTQSVDGNKTDNGTTKYTNTDDYTEHILGKRYGATYSRMLNEFRTTFLNIDNDIISELSDLFMNVW